MQLLARILVNAAALGIAAWLLEGIKVRGADAPEQAVTLLGVALVFGLVNAFVAPVVKLLSLPFIVLTLGLLLLVINGLMLLLTSSLSEALGLGFRVDGFGSAFWGALIVSVVSAVLGTVVADD